MRKADNTAPRALRCAIYTRKSTEEGLDQAFNSLDAQREACAAYILSQRHEGWSLVPDYYDDGGYSGGTMERPGLKALLAEVQAGRVDIIIVYKVDRLTRSLSDFARIVDILDAASASFVSVTQSFNTTTSMGRLTLNVLLSFAQFEREVTGERIRDKIAASKAKGMWMGGVIPLGYRLEDRKLHVEPDEANIVRLIFTRYLELGSALQLMTELRHQGIHGRMRINRHGRSYGGGAFSRGALYAILKNRLYVGEVVHKGRIYAGEHKGIIEPHLFDQVQQQLAEARVERSHRVNTDEPSPLAGLLWDGHGRRLSPSHAARSGKRYRYYVSGLQGDDRDEPCWRISAPDIETLVAARLASGIGDAIAASIASGALSGDAIEKLKKAGNDTIEQIHGLPHVQRRAFLELITRIDLSEAHLTITADLSAIDASLTSPEITVPIGFARSGRQIKLVLPPAHDDMPSPNAALLKLIAQAFAARRELENGGSFDAVAERLGYGRHYLADLLRTSFLSPKIITAIIEGRQPASLSRTELIRTKNLPLLWSEQGAVFGIT
ncbi:recombinase family protein [Sphingobium sp. SCG-1]|uniref:recombinase family protein n=1 Tax=Sphingobium sp. SCG-1 TaxID=2072936 RepID=UPI000CD6B547|nr:recombinase family protein [Sphingobium sp. SCG-1]AUW59020.1 recombinase family protein [Sphingobium sp. SCG-1]